VGGAGATAGPLLFDRLTDSYERHTLLKRAQLAQGQRLRIVPARFTTDGSLMGAVALALRGLGALQGGT
jgi:hypothetical protein